MSTPNPTPEQRAAERVCVDPNDTASVMLDGDVLVRAMGGEPEARWIVRELRHKLSRLYEDHDAAITAAVAAEREACAEIARHYYDELSRGADLGAYEVDVAYAEGKGAAADAIQCAIRARGEGGE